jgi:uncharacterized membrane protein
MSDSAPSLLFEAVTSPPQSLNRQGQRLVLGLLGAGIGLSTLLFTMLGAWPVMGFMGLEAGLVVMLFALHRRHAARAQERIALTEASLSVRHTDAKGRVTEAAFIPYWARVRLEAGPSPRLFIQERRRRMEIGRFLGGEDKRHLAEALNAALGRYRDPRFDNPQLR